ncbi:PepSY-associated TM helix domain-containing protein [Acidisoma cladoniae]|uniref:PepSY-associated TM helix domain-containing protein n=1 Tax=Acidisoma cladoniae TaxID=3040935 RepID=UPI00254F6229|nr:PepSY-associated TM helix domain-containing protein [Acidisoma sp. PAMC 29798]
MRSALLRLHRWAGLLLAGFLIMGGLTGSVIAFKEPLDAWLNPGLFHARASGPRLSLDAVTARFAKQEPKVRITYLVFGVPRGQAIRAFVMGRGLDYNEVFLDPVSGTILGRRMSGGCCLARDRIIPFLYALHFQLMAGRIGEWIMGGVALIWFLDCFVALSLTLPRARPFLRHFRQAWRIKRGAGGFRLTFDLHRAGGLWLWVVLPVIAFTGFAQNLDGPVFRPALSLVMPVSPLPLALAAARPRPNPLRHRLGADQLVAIATQAVRRGWHGPAGSLFCVDAFGACAVYFFEGPDNRGTGFGSPIVYVDDSDSDSGSSVLRIDGPRSGTVGDIIERLQFPLHSGQIAGLAGKIVVCISGMATVALAITGLMIWWRKRAARRLQKMRTRT